MPIQVRKCRKCESLYEFLLFGGQGIGTIWPECPEGTTGCPGCGEAAHDVQIGVANLPHINEYPRFDRGLNLLLESEQHRRRVMKERGLEEGGGINEIRDILDAQRNAWQEERTARHARDARMRASPEYREFMDKVGGRQIAELTENVRGGRT